MKTIMLLTLLALAGCDQYASREQIDTATNACVKNDGLKFIWVRPNGKSLVANCQDGAAFDVRVKE